MQADHSYMILSSRNRHQGDSCGTKAMQHKSSRTAEKRFCPCCQQIVSTSTAYRHRRLHAPPRLKALSPFVGIDTLAKPGEPSDGDAAGNYDVPAQANTEVTAAGNYDVPAQANTELTVEEFCDPAWTAAFESIDDESANRTVIIQDVMLKVSTEWPRVISPEDREGNSEVEDDESACSSRSSEGSEGLDVWDRLGEGFERDVVEFGEF